MLTSSDSRDSGNTLWCAVFLLDSRHERLFLRPSAFMCVDWRQRSFDHSGVFGYCIERCLQWPWADYWGLDLPSTRCAALQTRAWRQRWISIPRSLYQLGVVPQLSTIEQTA